MADTQEQWANAFKNNLSRLIKDFVPKAGIGFVSADLLNKTAELLAQCDDENFKRSSVSRFAEKVMGQPFDHVYDPDDWEITIPAQEALEFLHNEDAGIIKELHTLIDGPSVYVAKNAEHEGEIFGSKVEAEQWIQDSKTKS